MFSRKIAEFYIFDARKDGCDGNICIHLKNNVNEKAESGKIKYTK
jgi:hypothetical protein